MTRVFELSLAVLVGLSLSSAVVAAPLPTVVFQDTFNTSANSDDFNFEINTARQAGVIAPTTYSEFPLTGLGGGAPFLTQVGNSGPYGLLAADSDAGIAYTFVSPDYNFVDNSRFRIEMTINPVAFGNNPSDWLGLSFGSSTQGNFVTDLEVMSVLVTGSGGVQIWDGGGPIVLTSVPDLTWHEVQVDVSAPSFGSDALVNISVDGIPLLTDYNRVGGFVNNFMTLGGFDSGGDNNLTVHFIDDFTVSVPEPGSGLAVGATMGMLALGRRRRRA